MSDLLRADAFSWDAPAPAVEAPRVGPGRLAALVDDDRLPFVACDVGLFRVAFGLLDIRRVARLTGTAPPAGAPGWVIAGHRHEGRLLPVVDLRGDDGGGAGSVLLVPLADARLVALAVDALREVVRVPAEAIGGPIPEALPWRLGMAAVGALRDARGTLHLLDPRRLFDDDARAALAALTMEDA